METAVPDQNEDDIDDLELERDIAREIEDTFATVTYPGDDKLVRYPDYYESKDVLEVFRGKHWRDVSLDVFSEHQLSVRLLSPEGFNFYLPRFLVASLLHAEEIGILWESVSFALTPPESEGDDMDWLLEVVSLLDARQKAAIRRFIELWVKTETSYPDPNRDRALSFWRRLTE